MSDLKSASLWLKTLHGSEPRKMVQHPSCGFEAFPQGKVCPEPQSLLPGFVKMTEGSILPLEIYQASTEVECLREGLREDKGLQALSGEVLGLRHGHMPIQLDICGRGVIFRNTVYEKINRHLVETNEIV